MNWLNSNMHSDESDTDSSQSDSDHKTAENSNQIVSKSTQSMDQHKKNENNRSYICLICDKSTRKPIFNKKQCCLQCPHCSRSWCLEDPRKIKKPGNLDLIAKRYLEIKFSEIKHRKHDHHQTNHTLQWLGTNILGNLGDINDTLIQLESARNFEDPDLNAIRAQRRFGIHHPNSEKYHATHPVIIESLPKLDIKGNKNHKLLLEHKACPICQIDFIENDDAEISTDEELEQLLLTDDEQEQQKQGTLSCSQNENMEQKEMEQEDIFKMMDKSRKINNGKNDKFDMNDIDTGLNRENECNTDGIVHLYDNENQRHDDNMIDIGNEIIVSNTNATENVNLSDLAGINTNINENNNSIVNEWSSTNNNGNIEHKMEDIEEDDNDSNTNEDDMEATKLKINECKPDQVNSDSIARLWCGHIFHRDCVIPWLSKQNTCPLCRYELPSNNPTYELKRRVETYDDHQGMYHVMT